MCDSRRILIVDDSRAVRLYLEKTLRDAGFETAQAATGEEALAAVRETPDLVLLDLHLPDMSGYDVLNRFCEDPSLHEVPVIMLTVENNVESRIEAFTRGADDYLMKPCSQKELVVRINRLLRIRELGEKRRRAEKALAESEERYRRLVETMNDGLGVQDEKGLIVYVNDKLLDMWGFAREEVLGRSVSDFLDEENKKILDEQMAGRRAMRREPYEIEWIKKGGGRLHAIMSPAPLIDDAGRLKGSFAVITDITARKETEEALRIKDRAIESSINAVVFADLEGDLTYVNSSFLKMWGYDEPGEVLGRKATDFWLESLHASEVLESIKDKGRYTGELKARRKDGTLFDAQALASLILDEGGRPLSLMSSFIDVTERNRAEEQLRTQRDLAASLSAVSDLGEALGICIAASLKVSGMDNAGIYLLDETSGMTLAACDHLSDRFAEAVSYYEADSPQMRLAQEGRPIYARFGELPIPLTDEESAEGLKAFAVIPIFHEGRLIATLNTASLTLEEVPRDSRDALEGIASQIGSAIARIKAEEELRSLQGRYRTFVENASEAILVRQDGVLKYVNPKTLEIAGYTREEMVGAPFTDFIHADDAALIFESYERSLQGSVIPDCYTFRGIRKGGTIRWVEMRTTVIDWEGRPATLDLFNDITERREMEEELNRRREFLGELVEQRTAELERKNRDLECEIAERKRIEAALRKSEEKFSKAFQGGPDSILITRLPDGVMVDVNQTFLEKSGYALEEVIGKSAEELRNWTRLEDREKFIGDLREKGRCESLETVFRGKDGREVPVLLSAQTIEVDGQLCAISIARDVTEKKRTEEALRESQARLLSTIESLPFDFFTIGPDGRYEMANSVCRGHWGDLIGLRPEDVDVNPETIEIWASNNRRAFSGETIREEVEFRRGGERFCSFNIIAPIRDRDETRGVLGMNIDITEIKKLEKQLLQAQKMESLGTLAGGFAHDFNNYLNVILGFASLELAKLGEDDPIRESLAIIREQAGKAAKLARQALTLSRGGTYEKRPLDLNRIVEELAQVLAGALGGEVKIELRLQPDLRRVEGDADQLQQALMNLCLNARDAMPAGGMITIETGGETMSSEEAERFLEARPGDYVWLSVADGGEGMDENTLSQIFDPFFTTKEVGKGTGLGLAMTRRVVADHGGFIEVVSAVGRGSTFKVRIPCPLAEAAEEKVEDAPAVDCRGRETVLVIDDMESNCKLVDAVLGESGYEVLTAADGARGLEIFEEARDRIGLVIVDVVMPLMSGEEVCRRIRRTAPELPVILSSGYNEAGVPEDLKERRVSFLSKPYSPDALLLEVRRSIDGDGEAKPSQRLS